MAENKSKDQHTIKESTFEYTSYDCIFYKIVCSCGKECTGWTKQDAIDEHIKHLKNISVHQILCKHCGI